MLNQADLVLLEREIAKASLSEFIQMGWDVLEPGTPYKHNWHMDAVSEHLEATVDGEITRLLINVPPGTSKSSAASVFFPAWLWGPAGMPNRRFIGASHEQTLATRDNRRTRLLVESDWYQLRWPVSLTTDQNEKTFFENESRGFRQSSAVTSMTGKRGHYVVLDDPHTTEGAESEVQRETTLRIFRETLPTRMVDPVRSVIIVIMQRIHQGDVSGHILADELGYIHLCLPMEFEPGRRCYTVVNPKWMHSEPQLVQFNRKVSRWETNPENVPAEDREHLGPPTLAYNQDPRHEADELLFDDRFPRAVVDRDKKAMGPHAVAGQFQQRPSPRGGGLFKRHWFNVIPAMPLGYSWVRGWDLAGTKKKTSAYTAGVLLGRTQTKPYRWCVAHSTRLKGTPAEVVTLLKNTAAQDVAMLPNVRGSIPQDPGQAGVFQKANYIGELAGFDYRASPETGAKETRASPVAAQAEAGNVDIVAGGWNKDFFDELELFPSGKYADQTDALSRAFGELLIEQTFEWYVSGDN